MILTLMRNRHNLTIPPVAVIETYLLVAIASLAEIKRQSSNGGVT